MLAVSGKSGDELPVMTLSQMVGEEFPIGGGRTIDVVATRHGRRIAFEIEIGKSDGAANVPKYLDAGVDKVVVVAVSCRIKNMVICSLPDHCRGVCLTPDDTKQGMNSAGGAQRVRHKALPFHLPGKQT